MTFTLPNVFFGVLALATLGSAVMMLLSRNVIHAAFWLLAISLSSAGLFALLEADYVAVMQLLIYAGAVAILNIFTIMITMRRREDAIRSRDFSLSALVLAGSFFTLIVVALIGGSVTLAEPVDRFPSIEEFGALLFTPSGWALPFEIASLVLTAALVAAVWWSRERGE